MKRLIPALIASIFAFGAVAVSAAELTADERSEMRARAERMQADRAANPMRVQDSVPLDRSRGDVRMNRDRGVKADRARGEVKPHKSRSTKAKKSKSKKRKSSKRSLRDVPGALVRDR